MTYNRQQSWREFERDARYCREWTTFNGVVTFTTIYQDAMRETSYDFVAQVRCHQFEDAASWLHDERSMALGVDDYRRACVFLKNAVPGKRSDNNNFGLVA